MNIFIDMDEVVADFTSYANAVLTRNSLMDNYGSAEWGKLRQHPRLYRDLLIKEGGPELVDWITRYAKNKPDVFVAFLSAVPKKNNMYWAFQDKVHWANKHFPDIPVFFGPYTADKHTHCKSPDDILIDDRLSNYEDWTATGGRAHQYKNWPDCKLWLEQTLGIIR